MEIRRIFLPSGMGGPRIPRVVRNVAKICYSSDPPGYHHRSSAYVGTGRFSGGCQSLDARIADENH